MEYNPSNAATPWSFHVVNGSMKTVHGVELADQLNMMAKEQTEAFDCLWMMLSAVLVFWMQAGFAMLEVGTVRSKNAQNILLKNLLDITLGTMFWFASGYSLAYGDTVDGLFGTGLIFGEGFEQEPTHYRIWFFQWTFAATAATIVSGALAERTKFEGYALFSIAMSAFIYPVAVHWVWSDNGFLATMGFHDFAGCGVVHALAGVSALVGAFMVGPRRGRFDPEQEHAFTPHNMPLVMLGTVILWMGWYGFNCGSTAALHNAGQAHEAAKIAMLTTIAASFGGVAAFVFRFFTDKVYDVGAMCNGVLAGLVGITSICDACCPFSAAFCGAGGGLVFCVFSSLVQKLGVDDPLDAFALHGGAGIWGAIAPGLVKTPDGAIGGLLVGGGVEQLMIQLFGVGVLLLWSGLFSGIVFKLLKMVNLLRVSKEIEDEGMDMHEHGGAAYRFSMVNTTWRRSIVGQGGFVASQQEKSARGVTRASQEIQLRESFSQAA